MRYTDSHPLYHFFNVQRGCTKPSKEKGTFAKIKAELDKMDKERSELVNCQR
jgi:hypothetical protein